MASASDSGQVATERIAARPLAPANSDQVTNPGQLHMPRHAAPSAPRQALAANAAAGARGSQHSTSSGVAFGQASLASSSSLHGQSQIHSQPSQAQSQRQSQRAAKLGHTLQQALDKSSTLFHVFCSDPVGLNLTVFELWLKGLREQQVVYYRRNLLGDDIDQEEHQLLLLLYRDVVDQYRLLELLEEFFKQPQALDWQLSVQIAPRIQTYMVHKYYEFDNEVFRELLGRKLTTRARKDLDEVAESTNALLQSCRRQFDNIRRIFNALDERNFEGNVANTVADIFRLPWELSERYTCMLFLLYNRFHIQTGRKKTGAIGFSDLEYCAALLLRYWVTETSVEEGAPQFMGANILKVAQHESIEPALSGSAHGSEVPPLVGDVGVSTAAGAGGDDEAAEDPDAHLLMLDYQPGEADEDEEDDVEHESDGGPTEELKGQPLHAQRSVSERARSSSFGASSSKPLLLLQAPKPGNTSVEVSPALIWNWRMIKNHVFGTRYALDNHVKTALTELAAALGGAGRPVFRKLKPRYKPWVKSLLTIGAGLSQAKELRDFFEDVIVLLCEPLRLQVGLAIDQVQVIFRETHAAFARMDFLVHKGLLSSWDTYTRVMALVVVRLFDSAG